MLAVEDTLLVLLAAGRSRRFGGEAGKLEQDLGGLPLGLHAAAVLGELPFLRRVAVVGDLALPFGDYGFDVARNPLRDEGMASSLRLGVVRAVELDARAILVALADMPCISAAHLRRLFAASRDGSSVVASGDGGAPKPPALIGRDHFAQLLDLAGDAGARTLLLSGDQVVGDAAELIDIDTPEELDRLRASTRAATRRSD